MTTLAPAPPAAPARAAAPSVARDRSLDLLRAACTVLVVLLHAMMVGVTVAGGAPVFENALDVDWFAPVSWFVQMMPLFFLAGGATALGSWQRARARGMTAGEYVSGRLQRLLGPAVAVMAVMGAGLLILTLAGVPGDIVATAGFRMSQPLWFLGVFVLVQALVPAMAALHERRAWLTLAGMVSAVLAIDIVRLTTGIEAIGFLGLAAVWLLVQQIGFLIADGRIAALTRDARAGIAVGATGLLLLLTIAGPYSPDMYVNLNPPTLALVLLGTVQAMLFSLAQPTLRRLMRQRGVAAVADAIGARSMTVYLWHMPVLIGLAGLLAAGGLIGAVSLPAPGTAEWWATRPLWLACAAAVVALVALAVGRWERAGHAPAARGGLRASAAAVLGVVAVALVFVLGLGWITAAVSAVLMLVALRLATRTGENPRVGSGAGRMSPALAREEAGVIRAVEAHPTTA